MTPPAPSTEQVRVLNWVLPCVGIAATLFRVGDRIHKRRFWFDDATAILCMILETTFMAAVKVHLDEPDQHSREVKIVAYWLCAQLFSAVAWSARLSVLLTIMRITVFGRLRKILVVIAYLFGVTWIILFAQVFWVCNDQPEWRDMPNPQCELGLSVAVTQLVTDVLSDVILISTPIMLIMGVKLSRSERIRIIAVFSTSAIVTVVCINHAYWVIKYGGIREAQAAVIQDGVSLIVANLTVIIAFFFRMAADERSGSSVSRSRGNTHVSGIEFQNLAITVTQIATSDALPHSAYESSAKESLNEEERSEDHKLPSKRPIGDEEAPQSISFPLGTKEYGGGDEGVRWWGRKT